MSIPNFARVAPAIYRGGQPQFADDWQLLKDFGVTRTVKLNTAAEGMDTKSGMPAVDCEIDPLSQLIGTGLWPIVDRAVEAIAMGSFVHCEHGQDRTGLVVAVYRVRKCGWDVDRAETEMIDEGFHEHLLSLFGLWHYWEEFKENIAKTL